MTPFVSKLVEVIKLLALPPDEQLAVMPRLPDVPGEIADLFCDEFDLVSEEELQRELSAGADALNALREVAQLLSENPEEHSEQAMRSAGLWEEARALAQNALAQLGIEPTRPSLDWITYV